MRILCLPLYLMIYSNIKNNNTKLVFLNAKSLLRVNKSEKLRVDEETCVLASSMTYSYVLNNN